MPHLWSLFVVHRTVVIRNDEVVQGILHAGLDAGHPEVRQALAGWGGRHFARPTPAGVELTVVRPLARPASERWWLHLLLGVATLLTTTVAGAYFAGLDPLELAYLPIGPLALPVPTRVALAEVVPGFLFSVPLMAILLGHELGHYLVARRYGMDVSPPYFVPAPHWLNLIGTFGAFIRLRSAMINRVMLLDVGAGGPAASFALSVPVAALGLAWSAPLPARWAGAPGPYAVQFAGQPLWLGDSILFEALASVFAPEGPLLLHPVAFAGWLGLFVTALNLFPLAQLDGGHILYALVGRRQHLVGMGFLGLLLALGNPWWGGWWTWWLWVGLILLLGRGTIRHPSVFDPMLGIRGWRLALGWGCAALFVLTFIPFPIRL